MNDMQKKVVRELHGNGLSTIAEWAKEKFLQGYTFDEVSEEIEKAQKILKLISWERFF